MKLSLRFFAEKLRERFGDVETRFEENAFFDRIRLFEEADGDDAVDDVLFVASPRYWSYSGVRHCSAIVWMGAVEPPAGVASIWLPQTPSALEVLEELLDIKLQFETWLESAHNALLENAGIEEAVKTLEQVTENSFWAADQTMRVLYMHPDKRCENVNPIWEYQERHGRFPSNTLKQLVLSGEIERLNNHDHAWIRPAVEAPQFTFAAKTIRCKSGLYGYLFILQSTDELTVCDEEALDVLGDTIGRYLDHSQLEIPTGNRIADQLLQECLLGATISGDDLQDLASVLKWDDSNDFVVAAFKPDEKHALSKDAQRAQTQLLEDNLPGRVLSMGSSLAFIINATRTGDSMARLLDSICKKLGWKAGLGIPYRGLSQLGLSYRQASTALRLGSDADPERSLYPFDDYRGAYLYELMAENIPEPLLVHPDVQRIAQHDAETGDNLMETLEVFLDDERSIAKTSSDLYLHRNSVTYRLEKLRSLMSADLDDAESRLSVYLSIKAWKQLH